MTNRLLSDYITIADAARILLNEIVNGPMGDVANNPYGLSVHFVDAQGYPLPPSMTMGRFRELANAGRAMIVINDKGDGGVPVKAPRPKALI